MCCQWFAESILIQYDVNLQSAAVVTSEAIVRIGRLVPEIGDDNAPKALPKFQIEMFKQTAN